MGTISKYTGERILVWCGGEEGCNRRPANRLSTEEDSPLKMRCSDEIRDFEGARPRRCWPLKMLALRDASF